MARTTKDPPTLRAIARRTIERALAQARVAIPARVEEFDADARTVVAQPLIRPPGPVGDTVEEAPLHDVPVIWPGSGRARMRFDLATGDQVLLVFGDHAIDDWALGLTKPTATDPRLVDPAEVRSHDYTDAIAIPLATFNPTSSLTLGRLVIEYGDAQLVLADGGKLALGVAGPVPVEVVDSVEQAFTALAGEPGLSAPTKTLLSTLALQLATIKAAL